MSQTHSRIVRCDAHGPCIVLQHHLFRPLVAMSGITDTVVVSASCRAGEPPPLCVLVDGVMWYSCGQWSYGMPTDNLPLPLPPHEYDEQTYSEWHASYMATRGTRSRVNVRAIRVSDDSYRGLRASRTAKD